MSLRNEKTEGLQSLDEIWGSCGRRKVYVKSPTNASPCILRGPAETNKGKPGYLVTNISRTLKPYTNVYAADNKRWYQISRLTFWIMWVKRRYYPSHRRFTL